MFKLLIVLIFILNVLNANEIKLINNISIDEIANSKTWNQLLYYKNNQSEIKDKTFFLSKDGNTNKINELIETINQYDGDKEINDESNICKYPARYLFLSKYVKFDNYKEINEKCIKLNKWKPIKDTKDISVMLVSGYLSNPASTFGHSFIKLNNIEDNDLFSSSISFGALVPENENMLKYIIKGLSGQYESGYSDKYFYTQDLTYSNTEFRDMWEYKLKLSEYDKKIILLHLWEVITKKFDYYFLSKNCGYRVSQLLNLVSKENIVNGNENYYLPVETFNKIKELNMINNVIFIPSNKKVLNAYYEKLDLKEKEIIQNVLLNGFNKNLLNELNENSKIHILDFLMLYYKQMKIINKDFENLDKYKKETLIERFKYKVSDKKEININILDDPTKTSKKNKLDISYDNKDNIRLSFSPYYHNFLNISNLESDELDFLNLETEISKDTLNVKSFDLIKLNKINLEKDNLFNEFNYSWKVNIGYKNLKEKDLYFSTYGIGDGFKINNLTIYSMIDFSLINQNDYIRIRPNININYEINKFNKLSFELGYNKDVFSSNEFKDCKIEYQYNINTNYAINFSYSKFEENEFLIKFKYLF